MIKYRKFIGLIERLENFNFPATKDKPFDDEPAAF